MISTLSYRNALISAVCLHLFLVVMLLSDKSTQRPVLTQESKNVAGIDQPIAVSAPEPEVVKAVSVDNKEVMETVNRLKQQRAQQQRAEINRQQELNRQAQVAKQQRLKAQEELARLKEETNKIAIARKKQAEEEKKHLKQLAEQKVLESKRIEELKKEKEKLIKEQQLESKNLEDLNKKKIAEKARAEKVKVDLAQAKIAKDKAEHEKADLEQKRKAQALASQNAAQQARLAGEVDKYKALIVNAIGRNWILPENVDSTLSSQFRIRLAPDGMVLEVTLTRSSGDSLLDRSAQTAIYKASPLPVPSDTAAFNMFRDISLTVRPEQIRG